LSIDLSIFFIIFKIDTQIQARDSQNTQIQARDSQNTQIQARDSQNTQTQTQNSNTQILKNLKLQPKLKPLSIFGCICLGHTQTFWLGSRWVLGLDPKTNYYSFSCLLIDKKMNNNAYS